MRLYLAGPLFTEAELGYNADLATTLRRAGHDVYLPQEHQYPTNVRSYAKQTFAANVNALMAAQAVVAVLDGSDVDSGTAWECGAVYARGVYVYGLRTDFRSFGPEEKINLQVQESLTSLDTNVADLVRRLDEAR